jgi:hypothetical protein
MGAFIASRRSGKEVATMLISRDLSLAVPQGDHGLAQLVRDCLSNPCCARVLHWLHAHPATLMTVADMEALLELPPAQTHVSLGRLEAMGFVRRVAVGSLVFYGLTQDPQMCGLLNRFEGWCTDQRIPDAGTERRRGCVG